MYLSDIKRDDRFEGYLIVRSAEQRASANGKNYLDMTLADKSGSINAQDVGWHRSAAAGGQHRQGARHGQRVQRPHAASRGKDSRR